MKDYTYHPLLLVAGVVTLCFSAYFLPDTAIGNHKMRKADILSDLRYPPREETTDSLPFPQPLSKPVFRDSCPEGMTCIADYSDSLYRGMLPFYRAVEELESGARDNVRIAVFGDSFIEGDIITADLREMLQNVYGGRGVGFVPITSVVSSFRQTLHHRFEGWDSHASTDTVYFNPKLQSVSGHYFIPYEDAYVEVRGQKKFGSRLDTFDIANIYFIAKDSLEIFVSKNKGKENRHRPSTSSLLQRISVCGPMASISFKVREADSSVFYGITLDGKKGICVDNFSLRGSSGLSLSGIPGGNIRQFNKFRPYDLIILQFGLNVATRNSKNYEGYKKGMLRTIKHLKENFPQSGLLLVSVGDRDYKDGNGEVHTMPGIKNLVRYQELIASEARIAFWNLFEAMGGDGSMARLVNNKPPMANYDYTHINFRGGKFIATKLFEVLRHGKSEYKRRQMYEKD